MGPISKLQTERLILVPKSRDEVVAMIEALGDDDRAQLSAAWLQLLRNSESCDPWIHGFAIVLRDGDVVVGSAGFKGPPDETGMVEIAYGVDPEYQGNGFATEAAAALTNYAICSKLVRVVRAHTLPEINASTRVLLKNGFTNVGDVIDPDDGPVWRWERRIASD
jgi:RimJ/RimL family protein N-acetyltransferase